MDDGLSAPSYHDRLRRLSECGAGNRHGRLLRRFWQPVAVAGHLEAGKAVPIKIMDEHLALYRGESGKPHLVSGYCPHRRTVLHTGWVQGEEIRCIYHGWKFARRWPMHGSPGRGC